MSEEGFFRRWARVKSHGGAGQTAPGPVAARDQPVAQPPDLPAVAQTAPHPPVGAAPSTPGEQRPAPTLADVALLTRDSDFSAFVTQGVDKTVQRLAMKKLFSDPHFNVMDGLDVYIDDYTKPDPMPAAMRAALAHANSVFAQLMDDDKQSKDGKDGKDASGRPGDPEPPSQDNA